MQFGETSFGLKRERALSHWYLCDGRSFPWRETSDPWMLLLAEMCLKRTRVSQVARMFPAIAKAFPNPQSLAETDIAVVWHNTES